MQEYMPANINYEEFAKEGKARKLSDKESAKKIESAKKLTSDAYNRANNMGYKDIGSEKLDITKPNKNKPT